MTEPRKAPSLEGAIYALVLVVAIAGAVIAVAGAFGDGDDEAEREPFSPTIERARAATSRTRGDDVGGLEILEAPPARSAAGPEFVPNLPEVPDLATEPPPPRPEPTDDPRMAQLGVEMRILSRARELLPEHPAEALAVLRQHRRQHPSGVLREEREAFSIEALALLERVDEAERRYYEFRDDFPSSAFLPRLTELMQRPPHGVGAGGR